MARRDANVPQEKQRLAIARNFSNPLYWLGTSETVASFGSIVLGDADELGWGPRAQGLVMRSPSLGFSLQVRGNEIVNRQ